MSGRPGWREVLKGKGNGLYWFLALLVSSILSGILYGFVEPLLRPFLPWPVLAAILPLPAVIAGGLAYYILVRLRMKA
jgi:hypothetical protein